MAEAKILNRDVLYPVGDGRHAVAKAGDPVPDNFTVAQIERLTRIGAIEDPEASDYERLKKDELLALAAEREVEVPDKATKADIITALEADDTDSE